MHSSSIRAFILLSTVLLACRFASAQKLSTGPQDLCIFSDIDDTDQPYALYLPKDFNPSKKYPLVIMLHGAWSNHRLALRRVFGKSNLNGETDVEATRYFPKWKDIDYIVAAPFARGTIGYQGIAEKDVYDVLADVERRFPIDRNRVYLTGLSMGGGGTLWIGLTHPDVWAAIAPVCPAPPPGTKLFAPNALDVPVSIHQGGADPVVSPDSTRAWLKLLKDLGTKVTYTEYPGVGHNSWENAYKDEGIFKWFSKFRRNPFPDRVRFVTDRYKYSSAYWVTIDELTPGTLAEIEARFLGRNKLNVVTSNVGAFTFTLKGHPKFNSGKPLEVTVNGKSFDVRSSDSVTFVLSGDAWTAGPYHVPPHSKMRGSEGPIGDAFSGRQVYVYGTGGNPSPAELGRRRAEAASAASWKSVSSPLLFFPRVIPDVQVRQSDIESSNLILFGTSATNSVIGKLAGYLPIQLGTADSTWGLVYVYPENGHYAVICSGREWWRRNVTGVPPINARSGFRFMGGPVGELNGVGDFVLYKGSLDSIVVDGRFDDSWNLPDSAAKKMTATGAVTITEPLR